MPDGMTPEQSQTPKSSIEELKKAGPSEEQMRQWQGPEWKSQPPDIRMRVGNGEEDKIKEIDLFRLLTGGREAQTSSGRFGRLLKSYEETKSDAEKKERSKELESIYGVLMSQCIGSISEVYDNTIDQKKNAYPYDHRTAQMTIEAVKETFSVLKVEDWLTSPEAKVWIKRAEADLDWLGAFLQTSVGLSASTPAYFDIIIQLQTLKQNRAYITTETLERTFAKEIPGMGLSKSVDPADDEEEIAKNKHIGVDVPNSYTKKERNLIKEGEVVGLRELAIKMLDDSFKTRMRIAAVSQRDLRKANPENTTFMGDKLTKDEVDFYERILWRSKEGRKKGHKEGQILSPYITSEAKDQRELSAYMEAILVTNANDRLKEMSSLSGREKEDKLSALVDDVKGEVLRRISTWYKRKDEDLVSGLAVLITREGLLQDFSLMTAYEYCWSYVWDEWEVNKDGKIEKERKVDKVKVGGIYSASGDIPSLYWPRRAHGYDKHGNSRANQLLPTSREGRKMVELYPLNEMPRYEDKYPNNLEKYPDPNTYLNLEKHPDTYLREQWNFVFSNEDKWKKERAGMGYKDIDPKVVKKLIEWAYIWRSPFNAKYVGDADHEIEVPHFMPPGLEIANMLNAVTAQESGEITHGAKSIWKELVEGKNLSKINWSEIDNQQIDRWLVDCEMSARFMRPLIEVIDPEKDPIVSLLVGDPGTLGPKELAKRLRLTFRDSPEAPPTIYEIAMIPWFVTLVCANKHGISSSGAWMINERLDRETNMHAVDRFHRDMAFWKRALKWLPGDRPEGDSGAEYDFVKLDYGNTMALLAEFYESILLRMAKASAEEALMLAMDNYQKTTSRLNKAEIFSKGSLSHKFPTSITVV